MIRSKCLNCGRRRACLKIEARAPFPFPVRSTKLVWLAGVPIDHVTMHDYPEPGTGAVVELCRACLRETGGVLGKHLLEDL